MRVLVVEDDTLVAEGIKHGLEREHFTVDRVSSAEQAESFLHGEHFDLLIVDLGLPKADGFSLVRQLRQLGHKTPVLILTARDTLEDCVKGLEVGADDYMIKPFRLPELVARIRALIRRAHSVADSKLSQRDVRVLYIRRKGIEIPNPHGSTLILPGDRLLCYGRSLTLRNLLSGRARDTSPR